ncbi:BnaAnng18660D, partial [Brassica napus]
DLFRRYVIGITLFRRNSDDFFPQYPCCFLVVLIYFLFLSSFNGLVVHFLFHPTDYLPVSDINECISTIHKHNCSDPSTCRNKDGGFYCKCRSGYRLDTNTMSCKRKDFGWAAILLGTTIGFLSIMPAVSCVRQKMKHRKDSQLRQKFFVQNGGGLLVQRLSGEET